MNLDMIRKNTPGMILKFSLPSIVAMVLTALITVVDGFFVGNYVGSDGIAAVNLGLPIIYLYLGVGLMVSVGGVAISGMALGSGEIKRCKDVFNQTIVTSVIISAVLSGFMAFALKPILAVLQVSQQVGVHFVDYYFVMLFQLPVMIINASLGMFIRSEGKPQFFMKINILNLLINIVLDYTFSEFFNGGVTGIAVASLLAGTVTLFSSVWFFVKKSEVYKFASFTFNKEVLKNTIFNGASEFISEMSLCISMFAYNFVILKYVGINGVTAFAIVGYVAYMFSMIIIGFGQGTVALLSFAYGAGEKTLVAHIRRLTNAMVLATGLAVFALLFVFSDGYGSFFVDDEAVKAMIDFGVKIFASSFLLSGINTITSFYFTAIGKAKESAIISFMRGLFILLIATFTLPAIWGMNGVWLVSPVTEGITIFVSIYFIRKENKEKSFSL